MVGITAEATTTAREAGSVAKKGCDTMALGRGLRVPSHAQPELCASPPVPVWSSAPVCRAGRQILVEKTVRAW